MSGGQSRALPRGVSFLKQCNIILADEPTGSLDKKNATIVMNLLKSLNAEGKTVIIVTHDEEIKTQVDRRIEI